MLKTAKMTFSCILAACMLIGCVSTTPGDAESDSQYIQITEASDTSGAPDTFSTSDISEFPDTSTSPVSSDTVDTTDASENVSLEENDITLVQETTHTIDESLECLTNRLTQENLALSVENITKVLSEESEEITKYGVTVLPYLQTYISQTHSDESIDVYRHRVVATTVAYLLQPDAYDMAVQSPDGRYTAKFTVHSFEEMDSTVYGGIAYDLSIADAETDSVYVSANAPLCCPNLSYTWSDDSQYFITETWFRGGHGCAYVFDVQRHAQISLPTQTNVESVLARLLSEQYEEIPPCGSIYIQYDSFTAENCIKMKLTLYPNGTPETEIGYYLFNMENASAEYKIDFEKVMQYAKESLG